jgi:SAM-dependent methyltransferase
MSESTDEPIDVSYLNSLYRDSEDPWHLRGTWYEMRKRDVVMSCLPRRRYSSTFEPGCSVGELTLRLALRSDSVLAADFHPDAVRITRVRVAGLPGVRVEQLLLPDQWPTDEAFDLVVLSELGYFFVPAAWQRLCSLVARTTLPNATVIACHWRHDFNERTASTQDLHARLADILGWPLRSHLVDDDFVLDVWTNSAHSLAHAEGLR